MDNIITDVRIIYPNDWELHSDGKWYVNIPFECPDDMDTIMEFVDPDEYIKDHKKDFDSLNNGVTENNTCTISADHKPSCNMQIRIQTIDQAGGRIMYDKNGNPEYIPPSNNFMSMFGGFNLGNNLPPDIIDSVGNIINKK